MSAAIMVAWSSSDNPVFWIMACLAGIAAGIFLFYKGFRLLRYKRLVLDTPLSKIRGASIGLVEVTGTPTGPRALESPVTACPCFYYRVQAWQWVERESGKGQEWKSVLDETCSIPFFLDDGTGRVLVDSQGAEMDVHCSFSDEIGLSFFLARDLMPQNVRKFLALRGLVPADKIKVQEHVIQPGFPLFVFGTLGENPHRGSWQPHMQHGSGPALINLTLGDGALLSSHLSFGKSSSSAATALVDAAVPTAVLEHPPNQPAENFDMNPSAAISKGERGEPFTISKRSQKEVAQSLAWKSTLYIWGGPVLAILAFYVLTMLWEFRSV